MSLLGLEPHFGMPIFGKAQTCQHLATLLVFDSKNCQKLEPQHSAANFLGLPKFGPNQVGSKYLYMKSHVYNILLLIMIVYGKHNLLSYLLCVVFSF